MSNKLSLSTAFLLFITHVIVICNGLMNECPCDPYIGAGARCSCWICINGQFPKNHMNPNNNQVTYNPAFEEVNDNNSPPPRFLYLRRAQHPCPDASNVNSWPNNHPPQKLAHFQWRSDHVAGGTNSQPAPFLFKRKTDGVSLESASAFLQRGNMINGDPCANREPGPQTIGICKYVIDKGATDIAFAQHQQQQAALQFQPQQQQQQQVVNNNNNQQRGRRAGIEYRDVMEMIAEDHQRQETKSSYDILLVVSVLFIFGVCCCKNIACFITGNLTNYIFSSCQIFKRLHSDRSKF